MKRENRGPKRAAWVSWVVCGLAAMWLAPQAIAATYSYKITTAVTMPKGSAGEKLATSQPTNTKLTPCTAGKLDAITFTVTYDAGKLVADLKDVYVMLRTPTGSFITIKRSALGTGPVLAARADAAALTAAAATDIYVTVAENLGSGSVTETLLGGYVTVDSVPTGTWQLIGIVADSTAVNFDDPTTWSAWDVATFVLSQPWTGTATPNCS